MSVLKMLSDGRFHSGQALGQALMVSRTAVWKAIQHIKLEFGVTVNAVSGKGYRLEAPLSLLDEHKISSALPLAVAEQLPSLHVLTSVDSTNRYLLEALLSAEARPGSVVVAEHQSAGRGRRGRDWVSPFAQNLYLSCLWQFNLPASSLGGLSLAVSVAVNRALNKLGITDAQLKWPNDVYWQGRKLCGILLEMKGEAAGPLNVVSGIGMNVNMAREMAESIQQPWVDLQTICHGIVDRNQLAAGILEQLFIAFLQYQEKGFDGFKNEWQQMDMANGKAVNLLLQGQVVQGVAQGVADDGALLLDINGEVRQYHIGDVSLRLSEHG